MQIVFINDEIRAEANSWRRLIEKYGERKARKIRQRLDEITAASNLKDLSRLPASGCSYVNGQEHMIGVLTIPPHMILCNIADTFEPSEHLLNPDWEMIVVMKIIKLDGESHEKS